MNTAPEVCCQEPSVPFGECCQSEVRRFLLPNYEAFITTIISSTNIITQNLSRSSTESTSYFLKSSFSSFFFSLTTLTQSNTRLDTGISLATTVSFISSLSETPFSGSAVTLDIGAKVGIDAEIFLDVIFLILPFIIFWRSKRKDRILKKKKKRAQEINLQKLKWTQMSRRNQIIEYKNC